jgi:peptidoglycan/LPS O-acetylase OafA/YrhL
VTEATLPTHGALGGALTKLAYEPSFDGIRGLAVLAVIGTHFNAPGIVNGGLVGVTLFFVLSGYLITSLLLSERASTGKVNLANFYRRRAARLLPALALVLVAVATILLIEGRATVAIVSVLTSGLYLSNFAVAYGLDLGPLEHTWSLAIEEQFYLVWPVIMIAGIRRPRVLLTLLIVGIVASAALRLGPVTDLARFGWVYHHTLTRADALLVGCVLALVPFRPSQLTTIVSMACIVALVVLPIDQPTFATLLLLPTAIASGLVIISRPRLLGVAPLVAIGRISYGLYLWHVPLAMMLPAWAAFFGTFLLAGLSYRFVELPIRRAAANWRGPRDRPAIGDERGVIKMPDPGPATNAATLPPIVRRDTDPA